MDFQDRLERAISRGNRAADARVQAEAAKTMSEEELKTLHSQSRLDLSDHIESCLKMLADRFPGFEYGSILNDEGWGARITRDDISVQRGSGSNTLYSRLEMTVRPLGSVPIVELVGKATIRNKETFSRNHYQRLEEIDIESFREMIDLWVLEFAEQFAAAAK
ncbi:MAG: hypothetical protein KDA93_03330 [Planctomycetaceae bacterium]|nr:hypothetical protein [Planctomycetaceae bacterium]